MAVVGVLPVFLVGGLGPVLRRELGVSEEHLGLAIAGFFACTALTAVIGGRWVERAGAATVIRVGAVLAIISLVGLATVRSNISLAFFLIPGGVANGLMGPAANLTVARWLPPGRHGIGYGLKQSAPPLASMSAGAALPAIALSLGWRWAFVAAAAGALAILPIRAPGPGAPERAATAAPRRRVTDRALMVLAGASAIGAAAFLGCSSFLAEYAVTRDVTPGDAGALLAAVSGLGVAVRMGSGWASDRGRIAHLSMVAIMMAVGGVGLGLLAADSRHLLVPGAILALGAGWGWPGLLLSATVVRSPDAPAVATGLIQAGGAVGGIIGPLVMGALAARSGFPTAWTVLATMAAVACALSVLGNRAIPRAKGAPAA